MKPIAFLLFSALHGLSLAAETNYPLLPPADIVTRILRATPTVQAATSQVRVEEAQRDRLIAGPYEWNLRIGSQQRRSLPVNAPGDRFTEWNTALERPVRLPGKAALDSELGAAGIALAESSLGDALHEASRDLLKTWFLWLKESTVAEQWAAQVKLLERQATVVQRRQQLGDAARLEAVQADAAKAQASAQLQQAKTRQRAAAEDLRRRYPDLPLKEPSAIDEPRPIEGDETAWVKAILTHNHELAIARSETRRAQLALDRNREERLPDPSLGIQFSRERGGEEQVVGAYISIPLPGGARRAVVNAAQAQAEATSHRESAVIRKVSAEATALYYTAAAGFPTWQVARDAATSLSRAADMTARAYQLGEGSLNDLLTARRLANEAELAARLSQLDALEQHYRLQLDAHQLWDLD